MAKQKFSKVGAQRRLKKSLNANIDKLKKRWGLRSRREVVSEALRIFDGLTKGTLKIAFTGGNKPSRVTVVPAKPPKPKAMRPVKH